MRHFVPSLLLFVVVTPVVGQALQLVADINRRPDPTVRSSNPTLLGAANGRVFFFAEHPLSGGERWSTDGTSASTGLTRDIMQWGSGSGPTGSLLAHQGYAWFPADDGSHGLELWRSDGSTAGTQLVVDLAAGPGSSNPQPVASVGQFLLFTAGTSNSRLLWVTDGSVAGTRQLPGPTHPFGFVVTSGRCWFLVHGPNTLELWSTDGVTTGAAVSLTGVRGFGELVAAGGNFFFPARDATNRDVVWVSDGTAAGTRPAGAPFALHLTALGSGVVYAAIGSKVLWRTDGTAAGTLQLSGATVTRENLLAHGADLYFTARTSAAGDELWKTDGTTNGTGQVADLTSGPADTGFGAMVSAGSDLRFLVTSPQSGLWRTDGTAAGTSRIATTLRATGIERVPGTNRTVFVQDDPSVGVEPWVSDGTPSGTRLLMDVAPNPQSQGCSAGVFADLFGTTLMGLDDGASGHELWRTDGTTAGTRLLADLNPGPAGSRPREFTVTSNRAFFVGDDGPWSANLSLYHTDGATVSTVALPEPVREGSPTVSALSPGVVVVLSGQQGRVALWRSDGSAAGTFALRSGMPTTNARGAVLGSGRGRALAFVPNGTACELLITNGTVAGTVAVMSLPEPAWGRGWLGDVAYFNVGVDLWRSDGTRAGTARVAANVVDVLITADSVFFTTNQDLFVVRSGQVVALAPMPSMSWFLDPLADVALIVSASPTSPPWELWRSDGTPTGTTRVTAGTGYLGGVAAAGSRRSLFTRASFPLDPAELWETDGTPAGTRPLLVWHGRRVAAVSDGRLRLILDDGVRGNELWQLDLAAIAQPVGSGCGPGSPSLTSDDPVLGQTVRVTGAGGTTTPALAALLLGGNARAPLPVLPQWPCPIVVDPAQPMLSMVFAPTGPSWNQFLLVPSLASLVGQTLRLQSVWGPTGAGIDLTNGVTWRFGR